MCYNSGFSTTYSRYILDSIILDFNYTYNNNIKNSINSIINLSKY